MSIGIVKRYSPITIFNRTLIHQMIERIKFRYLNLSLQNPVIIYQMGKVGSTSVYNLLQDSILENPVFHIHFLSCQGIKDAEEYFKKIKDKKIPQHLKLSKILRRKIEKDSDIHWKIITLVREPIILDISDLFQNLASHYPHLIDRNGRVENTEICAFLKQHFMAFDETTNYTCSWFDNEIKKTFGVDIYNYPFNFKDKFCIITNKNIDLLVLRLENLDNSFNTAVNQLLSTNFSFNRLQANVGKDKKHANEYEYILRNFLLPHDLCEKIYSLKYVHHFYSKAERQSFIRRWSQVC